MLISTKSMFFDFAAIWEWQKKFKAKNRGSIKKVIMVSKLPLPHEDTGNRERTLFPKQTNKQINKNSATNKQIAGRKGETSNFHWILYFAPWNCLIIIFLNC